MSRTFALDIFKVCADMARPGDVYASFTEAERKGFSPLVVARWLSGTSDENQLLALNALVNPYIFPLGKHPHLLARLMQVAVTKTPKRYQWLPIKSKRKNMETFRALQEYLSFSLREVKLLNPLPSEAEIVQMAEELGWQKEELAKLKKEFQA